MTIRTRHIANSIFFSTINIATQPMINVMDKGRNTIGGSRIKQTDTITPHLKHVSFCFSGTVFRAIMPQTNAAIMETKYIPIRSPKTLVMVVKLTRGKFHRSLAGAALDVKSSNSRCVNLPFAGNALRCLSPASNHIRHSRLAGMTIPLG